MFIFVFIAINFYCLYRLINTIVYEKFMPKFFKPKIFAIYNDYKKGIAILQSLFYGLFVL